MKNLSSFLILHCVVAGTSAVYILEHTLFDLGSELLTVIVKRTFWRILTGKTSVVIEECPSFSSESLYVAGFAVFYIEYHLQTSKG